MTEYAYEGPKRSSTTISWSFEVQNFPVDAAASFSHPIAAVYQATIQAAFDRWSSVSGLTFTQVADSSSAAIRIGFGTFVSPFTVGETVINSVGGFLPNDTVVRLLDPSVDALVQDADGTWTYDGTDVTLLQVATHEIGHALGLAHTTDPTNIMYPVATSLNQDLSPGDVEGINGLYPLYSITSSDAVQALGPGGNTTYDFVITRHNDLTFAATVNYQITGSAIPGLVNTAAPASEFVGGAYPSGQLTFAPGAGSITLSVAVARSTNPQPDEGFVLSLSGASASTSATVRGTVDALVLQDGLSTSVNATTLSIYRFFDTTDGTHFFTTSVGERNSVIQTRPDLVYEGAPLSAVANAATDPAAVPVYRFFDTIHGTHFYTASLTERDTIQSTRSDLTYEGVGFYEDSATQSGDTAVYRFFDTQSGTHFFTSTATERATILATRSDYVDEGVAFYAPTSA